MRGQGKALLAPILKDDANVGTESARVEVVISNTNAHTGGRRLTVCILDRLGILGGRDSKDVATTAEHGSQNIALGNLDRDVAEASIVSIDTDVSMSYA